MTTPCAACASTSVVTSRARDPGGNHWTFGTYLPEAQAAAASPDSA